MRQKISNWFKNDTNKVRGSFAGWLAILLAVCSYNLITTLFANRPMIEIDKSYFWYWLGIVALLVANFNNVIVLLGRKVTARYATFAITVAAVTILGSIFLFWNNSANYFNLFFWSAAIFLLVYFGFSLKNPYLLLPNQSEEAVK